MRWQVQFNINEKVFLRDPDQSEVGRKILKHSIEMIHRLGLEDFTFRKLAKEIHTNESSVYRYFENKHRLLLYLVSYYWRWMEYQVIFRTQNLQDPLTKIDLILETLMLHHLELQEEDGGIDKRLLHQLVIREASKSYLTNHVTEDNNFKLFKPYKDLCGRISEILLEYNPKYPYARSLTSTVIEMSHYQNYFMNHLPSLTDFGHSKDEGEVLHFLRHLILSSLTCGDFK